MLVLVFCLGATVAQAQYEVLHEFAGGATDGGNPQYTTPLIVGSTLYGMTSVGGDNNYGTMFSMSTDGTGYTVPREFVGGSSDGRRAYGSLTYGSGFVFGMTSWGGANNVGTVFAMKSDGTGFNIIHSFAGGTGDGRFPYGSLFLSGSTLYGMTSDGGSSFGGTLFKVNTDGSGFGLLHTFVGGASDGKFPLGSLTIAGSTIYGMTQYGGSSDNGALFKMNTDGTGFGLLHEFAGGANDGRFPYGSLALRDSKLYGMTPQGGDSNLGTMFQLNTDGSGFTLLHEFAGGASDGKTPWGSLEIADNFAETNTAVYGMTYAGGDNNAGTVVRYVIIPEPGTCALVLAGLGVLGLVFRSRARKG